jgi:hypothetical protein
MTKKYGFQEHDSFIAKRSKIREEVAGISCEWLSRGAIGAGLVPPDTDSLFECDYAIVHLDEDEIKEKKKAWKELSYGHLHDCIFMLGSRGAQEKLSQTKHYRFERTLNGQSFACFFLIIKDYSPFYSKERCEEAAQAFFSLTPTQAESICNSEFADVPEIVCEVFSLPRTIEALPALCILCQGYLGMWWEVESGPEKSVAKEICEALELMHWNKVPDEIRSSIRQRLIEDDAGSMGEQKKFPLSEFSKPPWWQIFENTSSRTLEKQISDELRGCKIDSRDDIEDVLALVKYIYSDSDRSEETFPQIVAKAYIAIHGALEQS